MKSSAAFVFVLFSTDHYGSQSRARCLSVAPCHLECDKCPQSTSRSPPLITCFPRIASPPTEPAARGRLLAKKPSEKRLLLCGDPVVIGFISLRLFSKLPKNKNKNRRLAACHPFLTIWGQVLFLVDLLKTKNRVRFLAQK